MSAAPAQVKSDRPRRLSRVPKRLFLWGLQNISASRKRDLGERYIPFTELTMAVILGVVIQETAGAINRKLSFDNHWAILLITALLMFLEMYIVFSRYHRSLRLPYMNLYMFIDLVVSVLFVLCVLLIRDSSVNAMAAVPRNAAAAERQLDSALIVLAALFVALFVRQLASFLDLILRSSDVEEIVNGPGRVDGVSRDLIFRNRDVRAKLKEINFTQWGLFVPMIADLLGVGFAIAGVALFDIGWWSWVGLGSLLTYELVMFGLIMGALPGPRIGKHQEES